MTYCQLATPGDMNVSWEVLRKVVIGEGIKGGGGKGDGTRQQWWWWWTWWRVCMDRWIELHTSMECDTRINPEFSIECQCFLALDWAGVGISSYTWSPRSYLSLSRTILAIPCPQRALPLTLPRLGQEKKKCKVKYVILKKGFIYNLFCCDVLVAFLKNAMLSNIMLSKPLLVTLGKCKLLTREV